MSHERPKGRDRATCLQAHTRAWEGLTVWRRNPLAWYSQTEFFHSSSYLCPCMLVCLRRLSKEDRGAMVGSAQMQISPLLLAKRPGVFWQGDATRSSFPRPLGTGGGGRDKNKALLGGGGGGLEFRGDEGGNLAGRGLIEPIKPLSKKEECDKIRKLLAFPPRCYVLYSVFDVGSSSSPPFL